MAESNIYESIAEDAISEKFGLQHCDTDGRFLFMPKIEHNVEDRTMVYIGKCLFLFLMFTI